MPRLSQFFFVKIAKRIALAVMGLAPAPVLIPIPVQTRRETQLSRRFR